MRELVRNYFFDEASARALVASYRWPAGPTCPRCARGDRVGALSTQADAYKCYACRKPFSATIGTVFEASHVPLHLWLQAIYLITEAQERVTARQLTATLGVSPRTASQIIRRVRKALTAGPTLNREAGA